MPPRKRGRPSTAATSSPPPSTTSRRERSTSSMPSTAPSASASVQQPSLNDPWTDAEETALLKQLIKFKPTGLHKHMSMLSIYTNLLSQGYIRDHTLPTPSDDEDGDTTMKEEARASGRHMSIKGIWRKLESLYDLELLDEREEAVDFERAFGETPVSDGEEPSEEEEQTPPPPRRGRPKKKVDSPSPQASTPEPPPFSREFELPSSDESEPSDEGPSIAALKWERRFATASPSIETSRPPSPSAGHSKRGRRSRATESDKEDKERRDSSPPELPDLLPTRANRPVRFTPSFEVPIDDASEAEAETPRATRGRGRGRPAGRARGGRRSSAVVPESGSDDKEEEESEEEDEDEEEEDDEESSSSGEEQDEESPQKPRRGRPSRGRGRGAGRGRGRKK